MGKRAASISAIPDWIFHPIRGRQGGDSFEDFFRGPATNLAPQNDAESAILLTLNPGAYTAIVRGINDGTGIALVEAYQLDN